MPQLFVESYVKNLVALFFWLACFNAHADCQDEWIKYQSPTQQLSVTYSEGCYSGKLILSFFTKGGQRGAQIGEVPFDQECPAKKLDRKGDVVEFSCRKGGVSPLAGATYRFKLIKTTIECEGVVSPDEDHVFMCIKGCGRRTPQILLVPFGEGCA